MRPLIPFLLLFIAAPVLAQNRAATEQRLSSLRGQIAGVEEQVRRVSNDEQNALSALEGMDTEIALREELVAGYRRQQVNLRRETSALRGSIRRLEGEIERAKASYRDRARHAYIRGSTSDLSLILSAGSIPQMIARARYLRQFADRRRHQVTRIATKTAELRVREQELNQSAIETQQLLTTSQFEQGALAERRREREDLVRQTRRRRANLEMELAQRRTDAQALEGIVAELVAQERRREEQREQQRQLEEQRRLEEAARSATVSRRAREAQQASARRAEAARTASAAARAAADEPPPPAIEPSAPPPPASDRIVSLSGSFRQNRGRLAWPADGTVTGSFGTRTDPVYGTRIDSPGIDISTPSAAGVRVVFEGVIERVGAMSTYGTYVMISHGGYTTIYGNLSSVSVSKGQRVQAGQLIGRAGTHAQRRGAGVFFAIFEGETAVNPTRWLR
ncbi:MAG: peptidoglycan DD-metalloendopeptidase family protein [Bacteroidetes bacterium]|nr:peptidoglycan DD-metalloendopeptidase family protein [Bacteroidota bacterium]